MAVLAQGVVIAPLMGLMVYLGAPHEPVNKALLRDADWGGMLLLGTAVSMIYAGLDQGNRLDRLESGAVMALAARRRSTRRWFRSPGRISTCGSRAISGSRRSSLSSTR